MGCTLCKQTGTQTKTETSTETKAIQPMMMLDICDLSILVQNDSSASAHKISFSNFPIEHPGLLKYFIPMINGMNIEQVSRHIEQLGNLGVVMISHKTHHLFSNDRDAVTQYLNMKWLSPVTQLFRDALDENKKIFSAQVLSLEGQKITDVVCYFLLRSTISCGKISYEVLHFQGKWLRENMLSPTRQQIYKTVHEKFNKMSPHIVDVSRLFQLREELTFLLNNQ